MRCAGRSSLPGGRVVVCPRRAWQRVSLLSSGVDA